MKTNQKIYTHYNMDGTPHVPVYYEKEAAERGAVNRQVKAIRQSQLDKRFKRKVVKWDGGTL